MSREKQIEEAAQAYKDKAYSGDETTDHYSIDTVFTCGAKWEVGELPKSVNLIAQEALEAYRGMK